MSHVLLKFYLESEYPELVGYLIDETNDLYQDPADYVQFLNDVKIQDRSDSEKIKRIPPALRVDPDLEYNDVIDKIIAYLTEAKSTNVLRNGYYPSNGTQKSHNRYINFQVNAIKDVNWKRLYTRIGANKFIKMILNTSCYVKTSHDNHVQLFGLVNFPFKKKPVCLTKSRMLFKTSRFSSDSLQILPDDPKAFLDMIFGLDSSKLSIPKKFKRLVPLLELSIKKDRRIHYRSIFREVLSPRPVSNENILMQSSPVEDVIKFTLTIVGKIFPRAIWGSQSNKSMIFKKLITFIKAGKNDRFNKETILELVKITDIHWLGKSQTITSKQDYQLRLETFTKLMEWFLQKFISKLIAKFWHVTETTHYTNLSTSGLLYFTHSAWMKLTAPWLRKYIQDNLSVVEEETKDDEILKLKQFNYGELRLIPKKNDFRPLCVPIKKPYILEEWESASEFERQRIKYNSHKYNVVLPVLQLIANKNASVLSRNKLHHPRCYSLLDITYHINQFKLKLLSKNKLLSKIFMVKFDMKHCYDQLNQFKIIECFEKLFQNDNDTSGYYIRRIEEHSESNKFGRRLRALIKDHSNIDELNVLESYNLSLPNKIENRILVDRTTTNKLTKSEILDIIKGQVLHSTILVHGKQYERKQGVFQGFPLLATFCDMVYNSLVDEQFDFLLRSKTDSLLLRLVDDFLFISTSATQCKEVYQKLKSQEVQEYGAFVNEEKSDWINFDDSNKDKNLNFVGLTINKEDLDIRKSSDTINPITAANKHSFKSIYKYLEGSYRTRLNPSLLDTEMISLESSLFSLDLILGSVLDCFYREFSRIESQDNFEAGTFFVFILKLLEFTLEQFKSKNLDLELNNRIIDCFRNCVTNSLKNKHFKFQNIIDLLNTL